MARTKVDYGIDLGTTNSAICRMESGVPTIKKMADQSDTLPSCVQIKSAGRKTVGSKAYRTLGEAAIDKLCDREGRVGDVFIEFKRKMGSDATFKSHVENRGYSPEELSSEVLKTLKAVCNDEVVNAAVITIPAMFTEPQRNATMKAAHMAGFEQCSLLQEPIAAAMAYGLKQGGEDGIWMVFDFGGGTFDAALIRSTDGIIEVFDTEGNNFLGGKNIDEAIVVKLFLPIIRDQYLIDDLMNDQDKALCLRDALKPVAEECKKQLSFSDSTVLDDISDDPFGEDDNGEEIILSGTITKEQLREVCTPIYQEAVDCCVKLMKRNNLDAKKIGKLILVGGPTLSPIVRDMLREQVTPNVDTSIDPMTAIATGAALFSSTQERTAKQEIPSEVIKLDVSYDATTVQEMEYITVKFAGAVPEGEYWIEFVSGDGSWSSGKIAVSSQGEVIDVPLKAGKSNPFTLNLTNGVGTKVPCFPEEIMILQGVMVKKPPLAYGIGIETWNETKKKGVFTPLEGLEKGKPVPAAGRIAGLRVSEKLRPGVPDDVLRIPIYEGEKELEGKLAKLAHLVQEIRITGEDVPEQIAEDEEVELSVRVNESGLWAMEVYFPSIDWTFEKDFEFRKQSEENVLGSVKSLISRAKKEIKDLHAVTDTQKLESELKGIQGDLRNGAQSEQIDVAIKKLLLKLEDLSEANQWTVCEKRYNEIVQNFERIESIPSGARKTLDELKEEFNSMRATKDAPAAEQVVQDLSDLFVRLNMRPLLISILADMYRNFDSKRWTDRSRAHALIQTAAAQIQQKAPTEALRITFVELYGLLPDDEKEETAQGLTRL